MSSAVLDDAVRIRAHDPKDILGLAVAFPDQCARALEIFQRTPFNPPVGIANVVVCGMGGSAAGGDLLRSVAEEQGSVPVEVCREYALPAWANEHTWVVACSYSGNTEETLSCYLDARKRACKRLCITSGGELGKLAVEDGVTVVEIPGGQPPRTALGFLFMPLVAAAERAGILRDVRVATVVPELERLLGEYGPDKPFTDNFAKKLASDLVGSIPLIYGLGGYRGVVASRWKSQINENSKIMAYANVFPELCHNEIVGWTGALKQCPGFTVVLLKDGSESSHMNKRWEVTRSIIEPAATYEVVVNAPSLVARVLGMCYFGDFVSLYHAALTGTDPFEIKAIDLLKAELAKLS